MLKNVFKSLTLFPIVFFALILLIFCKPSQLNNPSDSHSQDYFETAVLRCALGLGPCNPCLPAQGPWGSFLGTSTLAGAFTGAIKVKADYTHNLYGLSFTNHDFEQGGIPFQGTPGSTLNILAAKFSAAGERQWIRYLGQRSDRPNGLIFRDNDGVYTYATTPTSILPFANTPHVGVGANSAIVKLSIDGTILWSKYFNDGLNIDSGIISEIKDSSDQSGFYVLGIATGASINPGTLINSPTNNDWFIQKLSYDGVALWTKYYPFGPAISNFRPYRLEAIPGGQGYIIVALVEADLNGSFLNGKNTYPGVMGNLVMKLDANLNYQWHRYLGDTTVGASDNIPPSLIVYADQTILTSTLYSDPVPSLGLPHPGTGIDSTIFYRLDGSDQLLNSSFVYNSGESVMISEGSFLPNGKVLITGSVNQLVGFASELDPISLKEDYRISGKENYKASVIKHCDGSFSSFGSSSSAIADSPIPFGIGSSNAYFSRFQR
ncbi:hypothetical protein JWG40_15645 [Leptospira sp. 201903074]|uniref:hypothetical protein n=1 Tax=Leptospira abararensis TaxID=2810036 RepID=UPI001965F6EE|nr:hypothetical protein [Leptospira abararensis]MBM9548461.1 hypothetical protein [Leptospira abararensis]